MNRLDLNGWNAVVTGGASGLSFAIAERLALSGAKVVIWDINDEAAQAAAKKLGGFAIAATSATSPRRRGDRTIAARAAVAHSRL
jgi:3-oxoacyl-[acyl-carrier protein] reductase